MIQTLFWVLRFNIVITGDIKNLTAFVKSASILKLSKQDCLAHSIGMQTAIMIKAMINR